MIKILDSVKQITNLANTILLLTPEEDTEHLGDLVDKCCTLSFYDDEPESEEDAGSVELFQLYDIEKLIELEIKNVSILDVHQSKQSSKRLAAISYGLNCILGINPNDALANLIDNGVRVIPNYWIVSNFDYYLGSNGVLTTCVDDYSVTDIVVTSLGIVKNRR